MQLRFIRICLVALLLAHAGWAQGLIRLKTRNFTPAGAATVRPATVTAGRRHYLVLFRSYPDAAVQAELVRRRMEVVAYVPDNALMVSASVLNLGGLDVLWSGPMDPADKISPDADLPAAGAYVVIFHADTDPALHRQAIEQLGFTVVENVRLLAGQWMVVGARSGLPSLAALDAVAYILPASTALMNGEDVVGCAGAMTQAGPVAQYVRMDNGWSKDPGGAVALRYFLKSVTPKIPETVLRSEIARAVAEWTRYANLTITATDAANLPRSIDIQFARFAHGDAYPFDGPGGALAHTYYPAPDNAEPAAGDMHLDADETWKAGATVDVYSVALHEIGHALGLGHSDNPKAVMYPYYRQQTGLTSDDIGGVQALYGKPAASVTPPPASGGGSPGAPGGSSPIPVSGTGSTPVADTVAPTLSLVSPTSSIVSTYSSTITVNGTASDNVGVTTVKWTVSTGGAGVATGTNSWAAVIPLLVGDNAISVRVFDAAGNTSWRALTVVRR